MLITRLSKTLVPPKLRVNVFHTDLRLYTMLLVDLGQLSNLYVHKRLTFAC